MKADCVTRDLGVTSTTQYGSVRARFTCKRLMSSGAPSLGSTPFGFVCLPMAERHGGGPRRGRGVEGCEEGLEGGGKAREQSQRGAIATSLPRNQQEALHDHAMHRVRDRCA